jgi:hypothetical protein
MRRPDRLHVLRRHSSSRAPRGDRPEAARPARALAAASDTAPRAARQGGALNKRGKSEHGRHEPGHRQGSGGDEVYAVVCSMLRTAVKGVGDADGVGGCHVFADLVRGEPADVA